MRTLFSIQPLVLPPKSNPTILVEQALASPFGTAPLAESLHPQDRICILLDDITRPTPHKVLLPPLLRGIGKCGVPDKNITFLIALGTHRPMSREEMEQHLGSEIASRFHVLNHEYANQDALFLAGEAPGGIPIYVNRFIKEAHFSIGISSIVPHAQVGWGGGGKIVLPGISGAETVGAMHTFAASLPGYPRLAGQVETPVRLLIEEIARKAGLSFIVNAIFNAHYQLIDVVAGDPVLAHRAGVERAKEIFLRPIPERADIVVVDAHPADLDYWQGLKPLTLGHLAVKPGGILILQGRFPEGISRTHGELCRYGRCSKKEFEQVLQEDALEDGAAIGALYQHILVREYSTIFCVSPGLSDKDCEALGFERFPSVEEALKEAENRTSKQATVGYIVEGGETVPILQNL